MIEPSSSPVTAQRPAYAPALRAIGQSLEALRVSLFDMEARGEEYLVWDKTSLALEDEPDSEGARARDPFAHWLRGEKRRQADEHDAGANREAIPLRYTLDDIDRLDREGRARRSSPGGAPDAYRLSQLLRAVGGYVNHVGGRLLGISWRDQWVGVVYEKEGRRELEIFRPASIYDFWVRMYLMRSAKTH
ncbi:MAG TPA: hypothetical protein VNL14_00025 [Candidatus Acidoferrales bacterium]|nr:hypothetical protein [Candidatus Acidoferrales bacterium]